MTIGSWAYMAPERLSDDHTTKAVDIYALACVLYETLTGARPFAIDSMQQVINAHLHTPPPRVSAANSRVPPALDAVIERGMAKEPDDRYGSAGALARAAQRALSAAAGPRRQRNHGRCPCPRPHRAAHQDRATPLLRRPSPSRLSLPRREYRSQCSSGSPCARRCSSRPPASSSASSLANPGANQRHVRAEPIAHPITARQNARSCRPDSGPPAPRHERRHGPHQAVPPPAVARHRRTQSAL